MTGSETCIHWRKRRRTGSRHKERGGDAINALIASIQHCSVHDGPGIRTTIFFKGCNMRCPWCHNPETVYPGREVHSNPEKCIGCGQCEKGCFSGAREPCGEYLEIPQIMEEIKQDVPYYGKDGGVTFSGGEPLLQAEAVSRLMEECRKENIKTAIETNLSLPGIPVEKLASGCELIMCDIKLWDSERHKEITGVSNRNTLENIAALSRNGASLVVRTPVVPGINDTPSEISSIAGFLKDIKGLRYYELISYHPLGLSKGKSEHFTPTVFQKPEKAAMQKLGECVKSAGVPLYIDGIRIPD